MRTRRSPRNQEILFRALFKAPDAARAEAPAPYTDAEIDAMWWVPKTSRSLMKRDAAKVRIDRALATDVTRAAASGGGK